MNFDNGDKKLKELYHTYLREEVNRPEVRQDRDRFIQAHFADQTSSISLSAGIVVPVLAMLALFLYFHQLMPMPLKPPAWLREAPVQEVVSALDYGTKAVEELQEKNKPDHITVNLKEAVEIVLKNEN